MDFTIQTPVQLASHLRALREARGWSQARLGDALGVGQSRVARIEHAPSAVSVGQFLEVLSALGARMTLRLPDRLHDDRKAAAAAPAKAKRATRRTSSVDDPW